MERYINTKIEREENAAGLFIDEKICVATHEKLAGVCRKFEKSSETANSVLLSSSVLQAIADAFNGNIDFELESDPDGTLLRIMPMGEPRSVAATISKAARIPIAQMDRANVRILVAEDNDSNYLLAKAILKGFQLFRANNGVEAVKMASEEFYDVILMDIRMPEMDGVEATKQIRTFDSATPIIAVTANAFDEDRRKAFDAGVNEFVTKPLSKAVLLGTIERF